MQVEPIYYNDGDDKPSMYKLNNLFNNQTCKLMHDYYFYNKLLTTEHDASNLYKPDNSKTYACYSDCMGIAVLQRLAGKVGEILEREVLPLYSYTRVYENGTQLLPHRDTDAIEISLSITLNNNPDNNKSESFYFASESDFKDNKHLKTHLETGDGLLFFGSQLNDGFYHWRDPTQSENVLQIFLHYVYKDGNFANNAYEWEKLMGLKND